jgi:hypothetical protein
VRAEVCAFIAEGFAQRFAARRRTFPHKEAYIIVHGAGKTIKNISSAGLNDMPEHAKACQIGEGDMAVAYWSEYFASESIVVRVLDSDEVMRYFFALLHFFDFLTHADSHLDAPS